MLPPAVDNPFEFAESTVAGRTDTDRGTKRTSDVAAVDAANANDLPSAGDKRKHDGATAAAGTETKKVPPIPFHLRGAAIHNIVTSCVIAPWLPVYQYPPNEKVTY